jgi:hypothetical protein
VRTGFVPPVDALMGSEHIANVRVAPILAVRGVQIDFSKPTRVALTTR